VLGQKAPQKLLGKSDTCSLGMLQLLSGQWTTTLEEAYEHLLKVYFSGCQTVRDTGGNPTDKSRDLTVY